MEIGSRIEEEEAAGKRLAWSPLPRLDGSQVHMVQAQKDAMEKRALQRENRENQEKGQKYGKKKKYLLTPRLYPNKGVLALA